MSRAIERIYIVICCCHSFIWPIFDYNPLRRWWCVFFKRDSSIRSWDGNWLLDTNTEVLLWMQIMINIRCWCKVVNVFIRKCRDYVCVIWQHISWSLMKCRNFTFSCWCCYWVFFAIVMTCWKVCGNCHTYPVICLKLTSISLSTIQPYKKVA